MGGSKETMHRFLEMFPPEIWATIASFAPGESVERLKLTGSKALWHRVTLPAAVRSINLGTEFHKFGAWPSFLNEFSSLVELSINIPKSAWWPSNGMKLNLVPKTLQKLKITLQTGKLTSFFVENNGTAIHLDEQVPHLEVLDFGEVAMNDYSWLSRAPQSLTILKIESWAGDVVLPASLDHLEIDRLWLDQRLIEGQLPLSLKTMTIKSVNRIEFVVSKLPPSLLQFKMLSKLRAIPAAEGFSPSQLPRSMTSLDLMVEPRVMPPEAVALLPPILTRLRVENVLPSSSWPTLPPTLKTLIFLVDESDYTISDNIPIYPFELLPTSITDLEVVAYGKSDALMGVIVPPLSDRPSSMSSSTPFPPHLTRFAAPKHQLALTTAKCLPRSLRDLTLQALSEKVCEHIPRGLTKLCGGDTLMSAKLIKCLPKRLMTLTMSYARPHDTHFDPVTGKELSIDPEVPEFHEHRDYAKYLDWKGDQSLPSSLTHLELLRFAEIDDSFANQNLPHLLHLNLKDATNFTDLAIPLLSRHLKYLNLSKASKISSSCFGHMPRDLTWLDLNSAPNIYDEDLPTLPHTLGVLNIGAAHGTTEPVHALLQGLPDTWTKLSLLVQEQYEFE